MNKILLFAICTCYSFFTFSQTTLIKQCQPKLGVSNSLHQVTQNVDNVKLDADAKTGYTWDLSAYTPTANTMFYSFSATSDTKFGSSFEKAPIAGSTYNSFAYTYFETADTALFCHGYIEVSLSDNNINEAAVVYEKPLEMLHFPFEYAETRTSSTSYQFQRQLKFEVGTFVSDVYGALTRTVTADGFGVIKLFDGKEIEVLRLLIIEERRDSVVKSGNSAIVNTTNTYYEFWSPNYASPVVSAKINNGIITSFTWLDAANSTFLSNASAKLPVLTVFPNPSNGQINLAHLSNDYIITVTDMCGKLVFNGQSSLNNSIDLTFLKNGFYYLNIINRKGEIIANTKLTILH